MFYPLTGHQNKKVTIKVNNYLNKLKRIFLQMVLVLFYYDKVWQISIFLCCIVVGESFLGPFGLR